MSKFCVQAEISAELTPPCMIPSCVLGLSPQIDDKFCGSKGGILPPKSGQSPQISSVHLVHSGCASLWAYTHQREISVLNSDQKPKSSFPISSLESQYASECYQYIKLWLFIQTTLLTGHPPDCTLMPIYEYLNITKRNQQNFASNNRETDVHKEAWKSLKFTPQIILWYTLQIFSLFLILKDFLKPQHLIGKNKPTRD